MNSLVHCEVLESMEKNPGFFRVSFAFFCFYVFFFISFSYCGHLLTHDRPAIVGRIQKNLWVARSIQKATNGHSFHVHNYISRGIRPDTWWIFHAALCNAAWRIFSLSHSISLPLSFSICVSELFVYDVSLHFILSWEMAPRDKTIIICNGTKMSGPLSAKCMQNVCVCLYECELPMCDFAPVW